MDECLLELPQQQAFVGKRRPIGDGIRDRHIIQEAAIFLFRIERVDDALAGLLALPGAHPFRKELDKNVGDRADTRQKQDHVTPRIESAGLRRMDNEGDIDRHGNDRKWHGLLPAPMLAQADDNHRRWPIP